MCIYQIAFSVWSRWCWFLKTRTECRVSELDLCLPCRLLLCAGIHTNRRFSLFFASAVLFVRKLTIAARRQNQRGRGWTSWIPKVSQKVTVTNCPMLWVLRGKKGVGPYIVRILILRTLIPWPKHKSRMLSLWWSHRRRSLFGAWGQPSDIGTQPHPRQKPWTICEDVKEDDLCWIFGSDLILGS